MQRCVTVDRCFSYCRKKGLVWTDGAARFVRERVREDGASRRGLEGLSDLSQRDFFWRERGRCAAAFEVDHLRFSPLETATSTMAVGGDLVGGGGIGFG